MKTLPLKQYIEGGRSSTTSRTRRVFVIYHAGEVYDKNSVRWYQVNWSAAQTPEVRERLIREKERLFCEYHNIGDSLVYDSTLKLLDCDELSPIDPNNMTDEMIDVINSDFSYGLIRGSNYLHKEMDWGKLDAFISKLKIPVVAPGIGMQAPLGEAPVLSEAAVNVVRRLSEHSTSIGVRGDTTAEALWRVGVKNVRVVGCPSMFRRVIPTWRVDPVKLGRLQSGSLEKLKVSFTLRREIGPDYVADVKKYLSIQKSLIKEFAGRTSMTLFAQGELFEKFLLAERRDLYWPLYKELIETGWADGADDWIINVYRKALFYSDDIPVFVDKLCEADLAMGFRVHGVLPSLANGIPGVLVDYDARTHELIDTYGIPSVTLDNANFDHVLETARNFDYGKISRKFERVWANMKEFLEENGVAHTMKGASLAASVT